MVFLWILFILTLLIFLYLASLRCRWGNPKMRRFTRYTYAHRGLHGNGAPENSLKAFSHAADHGFGSELDVHLSKDGRLVIMHDENLFRTVGVDVNISDMTAKELAQLTLSGSREPIPYLEQVAAIYQRADLPLIIELKPNKNRRELVRAVLKCLGRYPKLRFCLESFDPLAMFWVRVYAPKIVRGQLSSDLFHEPTEGMPRIVGFFLRYLMLNFLSKPDFIAYEYKDRNNLSLRLCHWLYDVQEVNWTVRNRTQAAKAQREKHIIIFEDFIPNVPQG